MMGRAQYVIHEDVEIIKLTSGCWVQRKVNGTGLHGPQKAKLLQMSPSQATYMPLRTLLLFETLLPP